MYTGTIIATEARSVMMKKYFFLQHLILDCLILSLKTCNFDCSFEIDIAEIDSIYEIINENDGIDFEIGHSFLINDKMGRKISRG